MKTKFYSLKAILERDAQYNIVFGERSNGKTYAALMQGLENYTKKNGEQTAIVRRWDEDFKGKRAAELFSGIVQNGEISRLTNGEWTDVYYYSNRWYLSRKDPDTQKTVSDENPFAYAFALTKGEHDKSSSYPNITTIVFDEFLTRSMYLPDEFVMFMNIVSTIVRYRDNVKIFMLGNTVNKYCPYFAEMGLKHIADMKQGDIDVYTYGESKLKVAVEYADSPNKNKPSDLYFAFDNPKLNMITTGTWEMALYPHCPTKYKPCEIMFKYFIIFDRDVLQCEIVLHDDMLFTFIHRKTTEIKDNENDLIYTPEYSPRPNYRRKITKPETNTEKKIANFFIRDKVFYQDNEIGEIVRNYLGWCKTDSIK